MPQRILERLPIFAPLSNEERLSLAPKMKRRTYKAGDTVVEQGIVAASLVILTSGVLAALKQHERGDIEVLRFAPGDCFCQASVLTGAVTTFKVVAVTRAVVYDIFKDDIAPVLKARPIIAADLGQILARREAAGELRLSELEVVEGRSEHLAARLADRVRLLFGLS